LANDNALQRIQLKLTAQIFGVKRPVAHLFAACLLTSSGLLLLWMTVPDEDGHIDHFGNTLSMAVANQVIEPLVAEDLIHLGVLANRMTELPEVIGAAVYRVDDEMLTLSGDVMRGRPFTRPVIHDGAIVGYVRLHIDETGFGSSLSSGLFIFSFLWMALAPALIVWGSRLLPDFTAPRREPVAPSPTVETAPPQPVFLITVNLFNQLSLSPEHGAEELSFARKVAAAIATHYQAEVADLPGTGLILSFPATDNDDRPFHAICAAFALTQMFEQAQTRGRYRLGVHVQEGTPESEEAIADAAVLSALARDNTLIISEPVYRQLPYPERIICDPVAHPLLEELTTVGGSAFLAVRLGDPHQDLVDQIVSELSYSRRSTASESTF
jgi:hypothetical protein